MKQSFTAVIVRSAPTREHPNAVLTYGHLRVIARNEAEARAVVEQHLTERLPLGFSEREMRKKNPKRTPWIPGLQLFYFLGGHPAPDDEQTGVVFND